MALLHKNGLSCYYFSSFELPGIRHGIYSRKGGVSPHPWESLNLGGTVGDERVHVVENRRRVFAHAGLPVESIYDVWQVHSADVIYTRSPRPLNQAHEKADAIITDQPGITLFMRFADCAPILLYDPRKKAIGIVHAGWLGTVRRTVNACIKAMKEKVGSKPSDILAGIGPTIGPDHYEVRANVIEAVKQTFGDDASALLIERENRVYFDLWAANQQLLVREGVKYIECSGICTACDTEHWYSHRAEDGKTGRFAALISLTN